MGYFAGNPTVQGGLTRLGDLRSEDRNARQLKGEFSNFHSFASSGGTDGTHRGIHYYATRGEVQSVDVASSSLVKVLHVADSILFDDGIWRMTAGASVMVPETFGFSPEVAVNARLFISGQMYWTRGCATVSHSFNDVTKVSPYGLTSIVGETGYAAQGFDSTAGESYEYSTGSGIAPGSANVGSSMLVMRVDAIPSVSLFVPPRLYPVHVSGPVQWWAVIVRIG